MALRVLCFNLASFPPMDIAVGLVWSGLHVGAAPAVLGDIRESEA